MAETAVYTAEEPGLDTFEYPLLQRVPKYLGELQLRQEVIAPFITLADTDPSTPLAESQEDQGVLLEERNFVTEALHQTHSFIREKAEDMQQGLLKVHDRLTHTVVGKAGVKALAGVALFAGGTPVVQATVEKAPLIRALDNTPEAKAMEIPDQTPDGYPYATAPLNTQDKNGYPVRVCTSYVIWKLESVGVNPKRLWTTDLTALKEQGELVDSNPTPGSMAAFPDESHFMYVEEVMPEKIQVTEFNADGSGRFSRRIIYRTPDKLPNIGGYSFVHFEIPDHPGIKIKDNSETPPVDETEIKPAETFMGAEYDKRNKNAITRNSLKKGTFIQSSNGQYRLVHDKRKPTLTYWEVSEDGNKILWRKNISVNKGKNPLIKIRRAPVNTRNARLSVRQNVLTFNSLDRDIPVANATRLVIQDDGKFVGYHGKKPVLKAVKTLTAIPRAAKAALAQANSAKKAKAKN